MSMQLNVYVPRGRASLLADLDRVSRTTGRRKNDLVLDALEQYLTGQPVVLGKYHMGTIRPWKRGELYEDRLDRVRKAR